MFSAQHPINEHRPGTTARQKIAVLGGGIAALSAVFSITSQPDWHEKYEITVYQVGWRLGGKCASGRNPDIAGRIEEHGLHVFLGFYENAFRLIRQCYAELDREPGTPLATWQEAFKAHSLIVLQEQIGDRWKPWIFDFPRNEAIPGDGHPTSTPGEWLRKLLQFVPRLVEMLVTIPRTGQPGSNQRRLLPAMLRQFSLISVFTLVRLGDRLLQLAATNAGSLFSANHSALIKSVRAARQELWRFVYGQIEHHDDLRRLWIQLDLTLTILYGLLKDDVIRRGFGSLNHWDFAEWLEHHGTGQETVSSAPVRALYDIALAYSDGDTQRPNFAAGTALKAIFSILFDYKGAVMWKMQAGMGDVVFAPLYDVLRRRGVRFEFFHRVQNLSLNQEGNSVATIEIGRQATLNAAGYQPLITVKGLPCWPDRPLYDQLVEGPALQERQVDLESSWSDWQNVEQITLQAGRDFDLVILGISIGALPAVCAEIIRAKPAWQQMVKHVRTTATQALQLWLKPDLAAMGWIGASSEEAPVQGAFVQPLNTWADMTHLVDREDWSPAKRPGAIAYFCGPLDEPAGQASFCDHGFPAREQAHVKATVQTFLGHSLAPLWPQAMASGSSALDPTQLVDGRGETSADPLDAQYYRANIEPTDRYVLSVKGSSAYRLRPDQSGLANLFLAGDWTATGLNVGCVEAATMSGLMCSRAITGQAIFIHGEVREDLRCP